MVGQGVVIAVERGIEAYHLRQGRKFFQQRPDWRQIVGLMKGRQRREAFQTRYYRTVGEYRPIIVWATMNYPMSDRDRVDAKLRYRSPAVSASVASGGRGFRLSLDEPAYGVAAGQAAVLYEGDAVVGAGLITSSR